jgi:hypothetical protein
MEEPSRGRTRSEDRWQAAVKIFACALLFVSIGVSGCFGCLNAATESKQQALTLANELHAKMAQGDWGGIYDGADQRYRDAVTREKSDALFSSITRKLGPPQSSKQTGWNFQVTTQGTIIRAQFETTFSKDATATESFAWVKSGDQYKLLGYHINSEELIER